MNQDKDNKKSLESVILTAIMSVFMMFSIYYFEALLFLFPIPFIIFGAKNDLPSSLLSLVTTLLIVGVVLDPTIGLLYFLLFGPFILVSVVLIRKRTKASKVVLFSGAVFFVSSLIIYGILSLNGVDLVAQLEEGFSLILSGQMDYLKEMGFTSYELLERRDYLKSEYETILLLIPSVMLISSLTISYINYLLTTMGLKKFGVSILNMPRFSRFRLPDNFSIGALIMVASAFIITRMNISYADALYVNIMVLLGIIIFIQGMSVVNFFLIKIKTKKALRGIMYLIILFTPQLFSAIAILGGVDVIFDLRKIRRAKSV